ncbi:MAG: hypothetical protein LUD47_05895 [Clostridia bacterium]|nr:hypothetical protein [Clostridia bacterium]
MQKFKKAVALLLTCAMLFSILAVSAFAADVDSIYLENAPDEITEDMGKGILSGGTAAANTTELSILGINVTSTDSAGALNAMSDASAPLNLLVFGSDLNEAPDPYLYNFYYNLAGNSYVLPAEVYDMAAYSGWIGDYTLLNNAKNGPTGGATADNRTDILVNGEYKYCDPVFFYEPDVLFGATKSSYDYGLSLYNLGKTTPYSPLVIDGWTRQGDAISDKTFNSTVTMANAVYEDAVEIKNTLPDLKSRYNNGNIVQCGVDYESFALGIYYYLQSRLNPISSLIGKVSKAGYCTGITVNENGGAVTITNAYEDDLNDRCLQYLDGIADYIVPEEGKTYGSYGDLAKDVELIIMDKNELTETQISRLNTVGVKVVDINSIMPDTVYGTSMQSADNILGLPYFVGLLYEGSFSNYSTSLSEFDYIAYFVKNIYHVNEEDVEDVVMEMISNGCGSVWTQSQGVKLTPGYDSYIGSLIKLGAEYYKATAFGSGIWKAVDNGDFDASVYDTSAYN